jgi:hypothetical protein
LFIPLNRRLQIGLTVPFVDSLQRSNVLPTETSFGDVICLPLVARRPVRGGLSPYELLAVLFDKPFWRCSLPEPAIVIKKLKEKTTGFKVNQQMNAPPS